MFGLSFKYLKQRDVGHCGFPFASLVLFCKLNKLIRVLPCVTFLSSCVLHITLFDPLFFNSIVIHFFFSLQYNRVSNLMVTPLLVSLHGSSLDCLEILIEVQYFVTLEMLLAPNYFLQMGFNKFDCAIPEMNTIAGWC
jgi:hypothetical protein